MAFDPAATGRAAAQSQFPLSETDVSLADTVDRLVMNTEEVLSREREAWAGSSQANRRMHKQMEQVSPGSTDNAADKGEAAKDEAQHAS